MPVLNIIINIFIYIIIYQKVINTILIEIYNYQKIAGNILKNVLCKKNDIIAELVCYIFILKSTRLSNY